MCCMIDSIGLALYTRPLELLLTGITPRPFCEEKRKQIESGKKSQRETANEENMNNAKETKQNKKNKKTKEQTNK